MLKWTSHARTMTRSRATTHQVVVGAGSTSKRMRKVQQMNRRALHEYEPGEVAGPMHTDPLCALCGREKDNALHDKGDA